MNIDQAYPSKYLKADDVPNPIKVVISGCVMGEVEEGKSKPILQFQPHSRLQGHDTPSIVLNVTNANMIKSAYGSNTDAWIGKKVGLWVDPNVQFAGKTVPGLRVKVFQAEPQFDEGESYATEQRAQERSETVTSKPAGPDVGDGDNRAFDSPPDFDDDIPF